MWRGWALWESESRRGLLYLTVRECRRVDVGAFLSSGSASILRPGRVDGRIRPWVSSPPTPIAELACSQLRLRAGGWIYRCSSFGFCPFSALRPPPLTVSTSAVFTSSSPPAPPAPPAFRRVGNRAEVGWRRTAVCASV